MTAGKVGLGLLGAAVIGAGLWLWFRNGVPIWLESAIAFCM